MSFDAKAGGRGNNQPAPDFFNMRKNQNVPSKRMFANNMHNKT